MTDTGRPAQGRFTRRGLLKGAALMGCSVAAHPLTTAITFASAPGDARLVVIILRGGMDGLDVVRPVGDPGFAALRPAASPGLDLGGFYQLHPALSPLYPLWQAGQLGVVHATSTPYRDKRSHFDGQDLLEAGTGFDVDAPHVRDGWLNRMLQTTPGLRGETAYAVGSEELKILSGAAPFKSWSPDARLNLTAQAQLLLGEVYKDDPLFRGAADQAIQLAELGRFGGTAPREVALAEAMRKGGGRAGEALAAFAAARLYDEARIAAFSLPGWDTHRGQEGAITRSLGRLAETILVLKRGLGPVWDKTAVLAMTEFGRTARLNGTEGTDHGTGGAMLTAGGALRGGRVLGRWPGLGEADLYDRRDLMPTSDVRSYAAWVMRGLFGVERSAIETSIFPGLDLGEDPGLVL